MVLDATDTIIRVVTVIASLGAIYFAYRLTKITGLFLGWSLIILVVVVRVVDNVIELMLEIGYVSIGVLGFIEDIVLPLLLSVLLLLAMYELFRTFQRQLKSS